MRILITNDDGITAPGLKILETIAKTLAGPQGEVWVVAPAFEQSGVGHCISLTGPLLITQLGPQRFSVEGSPADCVLAGLHEVLKDTPPDLILSGVNRGNNSAENALYSGTLGGAMEAALQGYLGIALSQYYGPDNVNLENSFDAAEQYGQRLSNAFWTMTRLVMTTVCSIMSTSHPSPPKRSKEPRSPHRAGAPIHAFQSRATTARQGGVFYGSKVVANICLLQKAAMHMPIWMAISRSHRCAPT